MVRWQRLRREFAGQWILDEACERSSIYLLTGSVPVHPSTSSGRTGIYFSNPGTYFSNPGAGFSNRWLPLAFVVSLSNHEGLLARDSRTTS